MTYRTRASEIGGVGESYAGERPQRVGPSKCPNGPYKVHAPDLVLAAWRQVHFSLGTFNWTRRVAFAFGYIWRSSRSICQACQVYRFLDLLLRPFRTRRARRARREPPHHTCIHSTNITSKLSAVRHFSHRSTHGLSSSLSLLCCAQYKASARSSSPPTPRRRLLCSAKHPAHRLSDWHITASQPQTRRLLIADHTLVPL